jgi:hypothetical protein
MQVGETDAMGLRDQSEGGAVAVEALGAPGHDEFQSRLVVAVEDLLGDSPMGRPVDQREGIGAVPSHADDRDKCVRENAADDGVRLEVLELQYGCLLVLRMSSIRTDSSPCEEVIFRLPRRRPTRRFSGGPRSGPSAATGC